MPHDHKDRGMVKFGASKGFRMHNFHYEGFPQIFCTQGPCTKFVLGHCIPVNPNRQPIKPSTRDFVGSEHKKPLTPSMPMRHLSVIFKAKRTILNHSVGQIVLTGHPTQKGQNWKFKISISIFFFRSIPKGLFYNLN